MSPHPILRQAISLLIDKDIRFSILFPFLVRIKTTLEQNIT